MKGNPNGVQKDAKRSLKTSGSHNSLSDAKSLLFSLLAHADSVYHSRQNTRNWRLKVSLPMAWFGFQVSSTMMRACLFAPWTALAVYMSASAAVADTDDPQGWVLFPPKDQDARLTEQHSAMFARSSCLVDLRSAEREIAFDLLSVSYVVTLNADPVWTRAEGSGCSLTVQRTVEREAQKLEAEEAFSGSDRVDELLELGELLQDTFIYDPCGAALTASAAVAEVLAYYEYSIEIEVLQDAGASDAKGCRVLSRRTLEVEEQ